jgi:hypothetical protein
MRLVIFCEGDTEEKVLKKGFGFWDEYLMGFSPVKIINFRGSGNFKADFIYQAPLELDDPETIVFGLIDLFHSPFKQYPPALENAVDPYKAEAYFIKRHFEDQITPELRDRCFVFPVVMEIETWLLADTEVMKVLGRTAHTSPEDVEKPVEFLKPLWKNRYQAEYTKPNSSVDLFKKASAGRVYADNCPHFNAIINKLLELQGQPAEKPVPSFEIPNQEFFETLLDKIRELEAQLDQLLDEKTLSTLSKEDQEARWREAERLDDQIRALSKGGASYPSNL